MKAAIDASLSWFGNLFNSAGLGSVKAAACGGFADLGERPREEEKEEGEDDKNWAIYFAEERALADARSSARNVGKSIAWVHLFATPSVGKSIPCCGLTDVPSQFLPR